MAKYLSATNYKEFTVGQTWSDGTGVIEIVKIIIPSTLINNISVRITVEISSPTMKAETIIHTYAAFTQFLKLHEKRIRPMDRWPDRKQKEVEGYTNNRLDKLID